MMILLLVTLGLTLPAQAQTAAPAAPRLLAISMSPRLDPEPANDADLLGRYLEALNLASSAGAQGDVYTQTWKELEPSPGQFRLDDLKNTTAYVAGARGFQVFFGLQVINTVAREVPPDLQNVPFDSPQMIGRFHALIDAIAPILDAHYLYLSIGNEVDGYLETHDEWAAYATFYNDAVAYIHQKVPHLQVGVTVGFDGARRDTPQQVEKLTANSDVVILTYYPFDADFRVRDPSAPLTDFPLMLALAGDKPLILQEVGYPTSALLGSSEQKQAEFVRSVFQAWSQAEGRIPLLNFFLEHDLTADICHQLVGYYGVSGQKFYDFLCTLGLITADGRQKPAWQAFVDEAKKAGFS